MSWRELCDAVAARAEVPRGTARRVLVAFVDEVTERVVRGERVSLRGLGTLERRWTEGRVLRAVSSRRKMWVGGRYAPRFRPAAALRGALQAIDGAAWRSDDEQRAWRLAETLLADLELYHGELKPRDLAEDLTDDAIEARCRRAFGAHWDQAARTFRQGTSEHVQTPFLAVVARRRWA